MKAKDIAYKCGWKAMIYYDQSARKKYIYFLALEKAIKKRK